MALSRGSRWFLGITVVLVALVGGGLWYANDQLAGLPGDGETVRVEVTPGASAAGIGEQLAERGVVKSALAFRLRARIDGLDANLVAGTYRLETGMSVDEAITAILAGPEETDAVRFTVREGLAIPVTLEELAGQTPFSAAEYREVLDARIAAGSNDGDVLQLPDWLPEPGGMGAGVRHPFEGMLFPQTYELPVDTTPRAVLQRMIDQLDREVAALAGGADDAQRYRAMIIASLIERETRVADERARVSGVIHNRLAADMPLQVDATVLYALGRHTERILTENTEVDSPYNTYQKRGLPPSPIAGFGTASLQAALNPADTEARYYVLSPACDGSHVFAETLERHNANKREFERADRCRDDG